MQASWWEGACSWLLWVDLCLGPLGDRAVSKDRSRGDWGLGRSLGNLSAGGWGYIPALLLVGTEAYLILGGASLAVNDPSKNICFW